MMRNILDFIKKNTETLIDASKDVGLEINVEKTRYILLSRHQVKSGHKRSKHVVSLRVTV
jgi:hypothetical protein